MTRRFVPFVLVLALLLGGCLHVPMPWSSDKAAKVERAQAKVDISRELLLRRAQSWFTACELMLQQAPQSPQVDAARRFANSGNSLLNQSLGALPEAERQKISKMVSDLLSENQDLRERGARAEAKLAAGDVKAAANLAAAEQKVDTLNEKLAAAYLREKELGDLVRKVVWTCIGLAVLAIVLGGLALYAKMALGGVGSALHATGAPLNVVQAIDGELSKFGQWMVKTGRRAAAAKAV